MTYQSLRVVVTRKAHINVELQWAAWVLAWRVYIGISYLYRIRTDSTHDPDKVVVMNVAVSAGALFECTSKSISHDVVLTYA